MNRDLILFFWINSALLIITVIEGNSVDSVTKASEKIQSIIDEVSCPFLFLFLNASSSDICTFFFMMLKVQNTNAQLQTPKVAREKKRQIKITKKL